MDKKFYNKIIDLIPSADLKRYVKSHDYKFDDKALLKFIMDYAPTFDEMISLFDEASKSLDDKAMRALAKKRIAFDKKQYDAFMQETPDTVYATCIKIEPNDFAGDTYITKTFDGAVELIKSYLKCYRMSAKECAAARYTVELKTTNVPQKPRDIHNNIVGTLGECVLDNKLRIIYLRMYKFGHEIPCVKGYCSNCSRCISAYDPKFPPYLSKYDLVGYYDNYLYDPKHLTYGILCSDLNEDSEDSYVLSIEGNKYIQNRNIDYRDEDGYYRVYDAHQHPSYCRIVKLSESDVPETVYADYLYAVEGLKRIEQQGD